MSRIHQSSNLWSPSLIWSDLLSDLSNADETSHGLQALGRFKIQYVGQFHISSQQITWISPRSWLKKLEGNLLWTSGSKHSRFSFWLICILIINMWSSFYSLDQWQTSSLWLIYKYFRFFMLYKLSLRRGDIYLYCYLPLLQCV